MNRRRFTAVAGALMAITSLFGAILPVSVSATGPDPLTESITLSPVSQNYKVDAGKEISDELTIINDGKVPYNFIVYSRPYSVHGEDYQADYTKVTPQTDIYQWVRFAQTNYHIEPNQTLKIPYTVSIPKTATPGGHYGVIFAETQPTGEPAGNAVVRKKRVGMVMYANVNGTYINKGNFLDEKMSFWQVEPPLSTDLRVQNTGNSDFKDAIHLTVKDVFGNVKYDATKQYPVLPQTTRKINVAWDQSPWFGLFKVEISQKFLDQEKNTSGYVLMMPRFIPVVVIVLLVIGGGYALYRHKKK